ncbi:hypothetical protein [Mycobacterium marinum]|uniref:hypothetical protein n=1 Tax=Mycobacterium marinum TaxID=1781 RepID=UPI003568C33D
MAPVDFPLNLLFGYRSHAQEYAEAMKDEADPLAQRGPYRPEVPAGGKNQIATSAALPRM